MVCVTYHKLSGDKVQLSSLQGVILVQAEEFR